MVASDALTRKNLRTKKQQMKKRLKSDLLPKSPNDEKIKMAIEKMVKETERAGEILHELVYDYSSWIHTYTGRQVGLFNIHDVNSICIEDIAHALSQNNRYNGHAAFPYSVAEHSLNLLTWAEENLYFPYGHKYPVKMSDDFNYSELPEEKKAYYFSLTNKDKRTILFHDAPEYLLSDMPTPFKKKFNEFKMIEDYVYSAIAKKFNLHDPIPEWISDIDSRIVIDEKRLLFPNTWYNHTWQIDEKEPLGIKFNRGQTIHGIGLQWQDVKRKFIDKYQEIMI